jgi:hypothetical protein
VIRRDDIICLILCVCFVSKIQFLLCFFFLVHILIVWSNFKYTVIRKSYYFAYELIEKLKQMMIMMKMLCNKIEWSIKSTLTVHVLSARKKIEFYSKNSGLKVIFVYSPILSFENYMNFSFIISFDFLSFCCIKTTEAHCFHHFNFFCSLTF